MAAKPIDQVAVQLDVPAPMRDGTALLANVYRPAGDGRYPVLLTRLPYGKDLPLGTGYLDPVRAARQGYIVVVQDVRGRFRSGGEWIPFQHEFDDGYDAVEWAARLPGADGRVAMYGASYMGMTQWQAAVTQPPSLKALAPGITWGNYLNGTFFRGGARELGTAQYWTQAAIAPNVVARRYGADVKQLMERLREVVAVIDDLPHGYGVLPLSGLPDPAGAARAHREWLAASLDDPLWRRLNIEGRYDRVRAPALHIGGWYDIFLGETLRQYEAMAALHELGERQGQPGPRLVVGPWSHGRFDSLVGELDFGLASSGLFLNYRGSLTDLHLRWYDAILKGDEAALAGQPPVELFVMGENRWRGYDCWPVPGATTERWYFHGDGALSRERPGQEPCDSYIYDPREPVPTIGGATLMPALLAPGARDQRANEDRPDVLCYTSAPLERDYAVIGPVSATLHAASSAPDTDFVARLVDVYPDGRAIAVTDGIVRASARESYPAPGVIEPRSPRPIEPDRVYEYAIDLWATAIVFKAGHRLRVEVTSSSFPRWDRNLNTGRDGLTSRETAAAGQHLFHDAEHPSGITLCALDW